MAALLLAGLPIAGSFAWKKRYSSTDTGSAAFSADELYHFDNRIGNQEFDLEAIHRKVRDAKWKLIYVIDELDKIEIGKVKKVIALCKNLFTPSDAVFIFLGDEQLYHLGTRCDSNVYEREKEYTYFNSRYYIGPPCSKDLERFFDDILYSKPVGSASILDTLKHCLFFEARSDFFDLITAIRGRLSGFEDSRPVIFLGQPELPSEDVQKSRMATCIASIYEDKYMSHSATKWQRNMELLKALYAHAHLIMKVDAPKEIDSLTGKTLEDEMIRDFNLLLSKHGALGELGSRRGQHQNYDTRVYPVVRTITSEPSRRLTVMTEFEKAYIEQCSQFILMVLAIVNAWNRRVKKLEITTSAALMDYRDVFTASEEFELDTSGFSHAHGPKFSQFQQKAAPYPDNRDQIEKLSNEMKAVERSFRQQLPTVISSMFAKTLAHQNLERERFQHYDNIVGEAGKPLLYAFRDSAPWVATSNDKKIAAVFLGNASKQLNLMASELPSILDYFSVVCVRESAADTFPSGVLVIDPADAGTFSSSLEAALGALCGSFQKR